MTNYRGVTAIWEKKKHTQMRLFGCGEGRTPSPWFGHTASTILGLVGGPVEPSGRG